MPTAVICSLFAGICAVTEFHFSIDYSFLHWSVKWTLAGVSFSYGITLNCKSFCSLQNIHLKVFRLMQQCYHFCTQLLHLHYINEWSTMKRYRQWNFFSDT